MTSHHNTSCSSTQINKLKRKRGKTRTKVLISSKPAGDSGLGAALAVQVRFGRTGIWVRVVVVPVIVCQVFFSYSSVSGAEASQQAVVIETATLLTKRVLGKSSHYFICGNPQQEHFVNKQGTKPKSSPNKSPEKKLHLFVFHIWFLYLFVLSI